MSENQVQKSQSYVVSPHPLKRGMGRYHWPMCKPYLLLALKKLNSDILEVTILVNILEGSCEIKAINSISKPKIVFHKYANSVRKIHISFGDQTGLIAKKRKGENLRCSSKVLSMSAPFWFLYLLCCFALHCLSCCGHNRCSSRRGPGFMKNFGRSGLEESGMPSRTSGWSLQMLCLNT